MKRWAVLSTIIVILAIGLTSASSEIIITSNALKPYAEQLANMHESMGISSKIVTIETIWRNYTPANAPPLEGYANVSMPSIVGYNYTLAMKIISYLRTQIGKIDYVTLFGDAGIIPPSYYIHFPGMVTFPTDYFYASPDYSMKPKFAVGRIPVKNDEEASTFITKLKEYYDNFDLNQFKNALFYGGKIEACSGVNQYWKISDVEVWLGELDVVDLMWKNVTPKFNATILFGSDGGNDKPYFDNAFSGGYGIVFHSNHGVTYGIQICAPTLYDTRYVKELVEKSPIQPIFISEGCDVGAYDLELVNDPLLKPAPYCPPNESFAEYLVIHNPGAIASIASTRNTLASDADFDINDGYVNFTNFDYMHVITSRLLEDIGSVSTLGEAFKDAQNYYVEKYDITPKNPVGWVNKWVYQILLQTVLLGDPTLKLPKLTPKPVHRPKFEILSKPIKKIKVFDDVSYRYYWYPLYDGRITFHFDENVTLKIFNLSNIAVPIVKRVHISAGSNYTFEPKISDKTKFLFRISNGEEETWYVCYIQPISNHPPVIESIPDVYAKVGENVTVHINATDPDGDTLTCKPVSIPEGARIENFTFYWTPKKPGDYTVIFEVSDGVNEVQGSFVVHVKGTNVSVEPVSPKDGETDVSLSPTLKVKVEGAEGNYTIEYFSGDGKPIGKGEEVVWRGLEPGKTYKWYVIVNGSFGSVKSSVWSFTTTHAPVANFTYTVSRSSVTFQYNGYDPDEDNVTCYWTFGDGSSAVGKRVEHVYSKPGEYNVTLKVVDSKNASSSITKTIVIEKLGPPMSNDLDGDGLYEDVNGDGKFNFNDVLYLQWHLTDPTFQKYKQYYDFHPDGRLDGGDVVFLYMYCKWGVRPWM